MLIFLKLQSDGNISARQTVYSAREYSDNFAERSKKVGRAGDSGEGRGSLQALQEEEGEMGRKRKRASGGRRGTDFQ